MYLIKSKIRSLFELLNNKIHFIVISIILLSISYKHIVLIFLFLLFVFYIFLYDKKLFIINVILIFLIGIIFCFKEVHYKKDINLNNTVIVTKIEKSNSYNNIKVKINNRYLLLKTKEEYSVGSVLLIGGFIEKYDVHYPFGFDYQEYLHYHNIIGVINNPEIKLVKNKGSIHYLNYYINKRIEDNYPLECAKYIKTLVIGNDDLLDTTNISKIGISHLFVISGLHVNILILILEKILSWFRISEKRKKIIVLFVCFVYIFITDFMISIIRVCLTLLLKYLLNKRLTNLDIICLNIIIVLIINPYYIYNLSFILTYLISSFMILYQDIIHLKNKLINKILNIFILTFIILLLTLPITISINPDINMMGIIVNPFFICFVTYLFMPLSFLVLVFKFLIPVYEYIVLIFEYLVNFSADIEFLSISLGNINIYFKLFYYVIFYICLVSIYKEKYLKLLYLFVVFILWYYKGIFNLKDRIFFLDLPNGESTLIVSKNNNKVILIDTAEQSKNNELTNIVKHLGIKHINYLIISHSDSDHIGGSFDLIKYIRIKNIVFNEYDKNSKTMYLTRYAKKIYYLKKNDLIKEKYFTLKVLSPSIDYDDVNDNSLVFILEVFNIRLLFTGDISTKVENDILKDYQIDVDFYKVAHHGSNTSTSISFISSIKFKYAVIMSGYYNKFGFPKKDVVKRFNQKKLLMTKDLGTIEVIVSKNKYNLIYLKK